MPEFRCYCPNLDVQSDQVTLSAFESHHLVATNRAREEDEVIIFDGEGLEWRAVLKEANRKQATLICKKKCLHTKPGHQIVLAIALLKGKAFETVLRQATELGVNAIQPLLTDHCQVHWKESSGKLDKWKKQLVEGCKQSRNPWLPKIDAPLKIPRFLETVESASIIVASLEANTIDPKEITLSEKVIVLVGPEGDFSTHEYEQFRKHGAQAVSLGRNVLRAETAAMALLSIATMGID